MLTGEGRLFVEQEEGTGIIREYHQRPENYVIVSGTGNQVAIAGNQSAITQTMTIEKQREPAFNLLNDMKMTLTRDADLNEAERSDLLTDVRMIEQQLRKREPNRSALAALLEPMGQVASIAGDVVNLIRLLNP